MIRLFYPVFLFAGVLSLLLLNAFPLFAAQESTPDPVFDVPALISTPLHPRTLKTSEADGIVTEEVMFHSEMDGEKSVDIFAFFSYPKHARNLPAFIWNQSGAARASTHWTIFGAKRGYATLCIDLPIPGYRSTGGYPINSGMEVGDDPRKAPIYHGAVALLKAVSYLQSRDEVDKERIGMAGSSWGGFFTTLMAGIDPRLKAASAMFGTGNLQLGNSWWDVRAPEGKYDAAYREHWRTTLDPALRLSKSKVPIAWFTGTNDGFFWMPAVTQTYNKANAPKHLSLLPNWDHGLSPTLDEQVFVWLDAHLKGAPEFIRVSPIWLLRQDGELYARWNYEGPRKIVAAELMLTYGEDNWARRYWSTLIVEPKDGKCRIKLPQSTLPFYISGTVIDENGFRYSTMMKRVRPHDFYYRVEYCLVGSDIDKVREKYKPANYEEVSHKQMLQYNGASLWESFEEQQIQFLKGIGWPAPPVSDDARDGKQSALLKEGKTILPTLLFTPGVKHRFVCYLKAKTPVTVGLEIGGTYDRQAKTEQKQFEIKTEWTKIEMEFAPPSARVGETRATFTVPPGSEVLCDSVGFVPVWDAK